MLTQLCCDNAIMTHPKLKDAGSVPPEIQSRLETAGLRRTLATRAVLGLFLAKPQGSLNHAQVFSALQARGLDLNRVTLYRLLERLVGAGVLHRHADDEARIWRFGLAPLAPEGAVPQFECKACHNQFPLPEASERAGAVAQDLFHLLERLGHRGSQLDLTLHGTCAGCLDQEPRA